SVTLAATSTWVRVKWVSPNMMNDHGRAVSGPRPSWCSSTARRLRHPSKPFRKSNQVECSPIVGLVIWGGGVGGVGGVRRRGSARMADGLDGHGEEEDGQADGEGEYRHRQEAHRQVDDDEKQRHLAREEELEHRPLAAAGAEDARAEGPDPPEVHAR